MKKKNLIKLVTTIFVSTITLSTLNVNAASTVTTKLPDKVTSASIAADFTSEKEAGASQPFYSLSSVGDYQLYCSERAKGDIIPGTELVKDKKMDYGIAYILKNSYPTKSIVGDVTPKVFSSTTSSTTDYAGTFTSANKMLDVWITQMAIWGYKQEIVATNLSERPLSFIVNSENTDALTFYKSFNSEIDNVPYMGTELWNSYVSPLITKAKAAVDPTNTTMSATMNGKWTDDGKNKKSGLITVNMSNAEAKYSNYAISLVNAPTTTKVYTEAGQQVSNLNSIPAGTKIYLVVPKDSISEGKSFTLNASATISYDAAYQYVNTTAETQPSVLVGPETKQLATALTIVPDTASSISNSIYFIGFIILLSGAGIIYANVKPRTQENN